MLRFCGGGGPDDGRQAATQRQHCKGPCGEEALKRRAVVTGCANCGNYSPLLVVPAPGADTGSLSNSGSSPISSNLQGRGQSEMLN